MDTAKALLMTDDPGPNERAADDVVLNVDDGETITEREGRLVVLLADRPEIAITWYRAGPGERGPDPHVHREHTDAFHVLEGELTFALGPDPELIRMPAGSFVAAPPNVVHTFANESSADACWLNLHAPDTGFAAYLTAQGSRSTSSPRPPTAGCRRATRSLRAPTRASGWCPAAASRS
jgi:quercetin dioxygenase-like cupin family protein